MRYFRGVLRRGWLWRGIKILAWNQILARKCHLLAIFWRGRFSGNAEIALPGTQKTKNMQIEPNHHRSATRDGEITAQRRNCIVPGLANGSPTGAWQITALRGSGTPPASGLGLVPGRCWSGIGEWLVFIKSGIGLHFACEAG